MTEAFAVVVGPARAEALTCRVLDLIPLEPIDRRATLHALLIELPKLPETPITLIREPAPLHFGVPELPDLRAVATMLNLTPAELDWFADRGGWLRTAREPLSHYRYRHLPKSNGTRLVEAPKPRLREIQRTIAHRILSHIPAHPACHGFEKGCSAATFAAPHAQASVVVRMDLRDFFSTIGVARVRGVYRGCGYPDDVARILADLCTTATASTSLRTLDPRQRTLLKTPHLPQGGPTSPRLANLIAHNLDRRIAGYARRHNLIYTRYADDLALSGPAATDTDAAIWTLTTIARDEGFTINPAKTLIRHQHQRQTLAGLVVNSHPAVPRPTYDDLRAILHNCRQTGAAAQNHHSHPDFRAHIYGLIAWIGEHSPARRQRLLAVADQICWD
ncbi:reverse transcriptase family protein [Nocardia sp. NPDC051756]|uniref:reverse transcriptase family protein n=1 Tax=Nocardia sp. NPDC051756 TaxID=3154751 RepID=UPI00343B4171